MQVEKSGRRDKERATEKSEANYQRTKIDATASCHSLVRSGCGCACVSSVREEEQRIITPLTANGAN